MIYREHKTLTGRGGAWFSDCNRYRYKLYRIWDDSLPLICFVMLNPSTADDLQLDPTLKRCKARAMKLGYGGFSVLNLFAYRATDPAEMKRQADPVGPENDETILREVAQVDAAICGWGNDGAHMQRAYAVTELLERVAAGKLFALKVNGDNGKGHPSHPLYLSYDLQPKPYRFLAW